MFPEFSEKDPVNVATVIDLKASKYEVAQIAEIMGMSQRAVLRILRGNHPRPAGLGTVVKEKKRKEQEEEVDPVAEAARRLEMKKELGRQQAMLKDVAGELSFRKFLEDLAEKTTARLPAPPPYRPTRTPATGTTEETLVLVLSDWHYGGCVNRDEVQGLNEYNPYLAAARVKSVVEKVIQLKKKLEVGGWRFPRLVVAANGDMVEGQIHEAEKHSDPDNVFLSTYECGRLLALALRDLAAEFPAVDVQCTSGNHGRPADRKTPHQHEATRNFDTMVYLIAKTALEGCKNVSFSIPNGYTAEFDVEGYLFASNHGHDIKSALSIPAYGINRMLSTLNATRSGRLIRKPIDYLIVSHFHSRLSADYGGAEYFVNGSLIGGTPYSVNKLGKADVPCQWLLGVHRNHGVTHRWPIYPDDSTEPYPFRDDTVGVKVD